MKLLGNYIEEISGIYWDHITLLLLHISTLVLYLPFCIFPGLSLLVLAVYPASARAGPFPAECPVNCKPELQPLILARSAHCLAGHGSHHSISTLNNILDKYLALQWPLKKYWENMQNQYWKYVGQTRTRPVDSSTLLSA